MSRIYDNWERLVGEVIKREQFREMALAPPSRESSFSSSFASSSRHDELADVYLEHPEILSLHELKVATDDFSNINIIGSGGFGKVYKGRLADDIRMGGRMSMLNNRTNGTLCIKERQFFDGYNRDGKEIQVNAGCCRYDFAATTFKVRNRYSNRPSAIILSLGGVEYFPPLTSEHFLPYAELIFELCDDGLLRILGVRAKLTDVFRMWGFGFQGRDYSQRKKELIYCSL